MCIRDRHILFETPAGYALFRVTNEKKLAKIESFTPDDLTPEKISKLVQLASFQKFKDTKEAIVATSKIIKGKLPKSLKKFLKENIITKEVQDNLAIADKKLGKAITEKLGITCTLNSQVEELFRVIRFGLQDIITGLSENELKSMNLGLAHGLSRFKLKFSTEKVDTMIVQAISLIDDLDREINNYMMRLREWYGWHFPELSKILTDNLIYAKTVQLIGIRTKAHKTDLSTVLTEEIEKEVKDAAEISMGSEISERDEQLILDLSHQIIEFADYKESLSEYLKNRMNALAPNFTTLVGELVGARLVSHAGSLVNLAKCPASTIQILGAEKALFKAMRTKHNTPKYGIIYQSSLVGSTSARLKGKISRALAAKSAVCIRVDALGEAENPDLGVQCKDYIESRIRFLENTGTGTDAPRKGVKPQARPAPQPETTSRYNAENDFSVKVPKLSQTFVASKGGDDTALGKRKGGAVEGENGLKKKKKTEQFERISDDGGWRQQWEGRGG
eukprot:TRINITY_DN6827_c0_g1_i17.p1 TRINITY_DN6827_c0_g1~~TRINITY_DN6827_c0_g1_i17.p1  ORF type:complete len:531 (-),score=239.02 TRINITY_DN6827_c0_g1_i17:455-1969(-)